MATYRKKSSPNYFEKIKPFLSLSTTDSPKILNRDQQLSMEQQYFVDLKNFIRHCDNDEKLDKFHNNRKIYINLLSKFLETANALFIGDSKYHYDRLPIAKRIENLERLKSLVWRLEQEAITGEYVINDNSIRLSIFERSLELKIGEHINNYLDKFSFDTSVRNLEKNKITNTHVYFIINAMISRLNPNIVNSPISRPSLSDRSIKKKQKL